MVMSLFHASLLRLMPSHFIIIFSSVIFPVSMPIKEFTILKVDAGKVLAVSNAMSYTVISPVLLFSIEKQPSTLFASKYCFRLLSIFALFTEQEDMETKMQKLKRERK